VSEITDEDIALLNEEFQGKYVCYDANDGGACWGRIKCACTVNTMDGEKPAFILEDRYVRYARGTDAKRYYRYYPMGDGASGVSVGDDGLPEELWFQVKKVRGDSVLRFDQIDLERDVISMVGFEGVSTDLLFLVFMAGREQGSVDGKSAIEIGLRSLMQSTEGRQLQERLKQELTERMEESDDS